MKIHNNVNFSTCTQEEGIDLLRLAGFTVRIKDRTFGVYYKGTKRYGSSNINELQNPAFLMTHFIKDHSYYKGLTDGKNEIRRKFKELLNIN